MNLLYIAIFTIGALLYAWLLPARWRQWALMIASVVIVYRLQPDLLVRYVDFVLPTLTLILCVVVWWLTRIPQPETQREDRISFAIIVAIIIGLSLTRYLIPELRPLPSRPPEIIWVIVGLLGTTAILSGLYWALRGWKKLLGAAIILIVVLFVVLKTEPFATAVSAVLRSWNAQDVTLASAADLGWLGFSYVAFRLIHMLRERQMGKLPALSLA